MKKSPLIFVLLAGVLAGCYSEPTSSVSDEKTSLSGEQLTDSSIGSLESSTQSSLNTSIESVAVYHTVTFDPNNGEPAFTQQVEDGKKAIKPNDPEKKGHSLQNWIESASQEAWSFAGDVVTGDITLTANYTVNQYTITFEDGFGNVLSTITQDYGTTVEKEMPANPTNDFYEFAGWDGNIPDTMPAENITIRAKWISLYFGFSQDSLISYTGEKTDVTIPSYTPDGKPVASIGDYAFRFNSSLTSVTIPSTVVSIGTSAFSCCTNLKSATIPEGVTSIGEMAFNGCKSLASIAIPSTVTSIGNSAFLGCTKLKSVNIPEGVASIGYSTFTGCSSLTSVTIPSTVTSIGRRAFKDCSHLTIYCEASSKPSEWSSDWNCSNRPVVWGYKRKVI